MERISITIPASLLERVEEEVKHWQTGNTRDNRAKFICECIRKGLPANE